MLEILKFARAAVSKDPNLPTLNHFLLKDGTITATNNFLTLHAPFPVNLHCAPHADAFIKAVEACEGAVALTLEASPDNKTHRLIVKSGRFRAVVPCADAERFPLIFPQGQTFPVSGEILPALKTLLPFVATDDLRPWACGILLSNNSAYAANNVSIVEHWLPVAFPVIANLPTEAAKELVRLGLEPSHVTAEAHQVTFHLEGGAWACARLMATQWPDVQAIFDNANRFTGPFTDGEELGSIMNDVRKLHKFTDEMDTLFFRQGRISTMRSEGGATLENEAQGWRGVYGSGYLLAIAEVADKVGFGAYPGPVPFFGGALMRGVLAPRIDS